MSEIWAGNIPEYESIIGPHAWKTTNTSTDITWSHLSAFIRTLPCKGTNVKNKANTITF